MKQQFKEALLANIANMLPVFCYPAAVPSHTLDRVKNEPLNEVIRFHDQLLRDCKHIVNAYAS